MKNTMKICAANWQRFSHDRRKAKRGPDRREHISHKPGMFDDWRSAAFHIAGISAAVACVGYGIWMLIA